jgi:hypothetical protein
MDVDGPAGNLTGGSFVGLLDDLHPTRAEDPFSFCGERIGITAFVSRSLGIASSVLDNQSNEGIRGIC